MSAGKAADGEGAGKGGADGGPGVATAALVKAAETKPAGTSDPAVSAAFALGWHMAELAEEHSGGKDRSGLPGLSKLSAQQKLALKINQIVEGVNTLKQPVAQAGLDPIDLTDLKALVQKQKDADAVLATHEQLLTTLIAAKPQLGNAYGLGRALADSCHEPADLAGLKTELNPYRIANLLRWLDDLASVFPPHAAHSVAISLAKWRDALYPPSSARFLATANPRKQLRYWHERRRRPTPISAADPQTTEEAVKAFRRQGELWRALLSGEKQGTDMLEIDNYLDAAKDLTHRMAVIARRAVVRVPVLSVVIIALIGLGIGLLAQGSSSQLVAGATSVVAALGLTWKGIGGALGQLAGRLEQPLWGAVLDDGIANAITLLPDNTAEHGGRRKVALAVAAETRSDTPTGPQSP